MDENMPDGTVMRQPLQRVVGTTTTDRMGQEVSPHAFWMTKEYVLSLSCGHEQVRTSCNFGNKADTDLFPKSVRCAECAPVAKTAARKKAKPEPRFDPVAASLVTELIRLDPSREDELLALMLSPGFAWETDERRRCSTWALVGLAVARLHGSSEPEDTKMRAIMDECFAAWERYAADPSADNKVVFRKAVRRVYRRQHKAVSWFAARGIVSAARCCSERPADVMDGLIDSIGWADPARPAMYERAHEARARLDNAAGLAMLLDIRGRVLGTDADDEHGTDLSIAAISQVHARQSELRELLGVAMDVGNLSPERAPALAWVVDEFARAATRSR